MHHAASGVLSSLGTIVPLGFGAAIVIMPPVKIIVRRPDTGIYLSLPDSWTDDPSQATVFPNSTQAISLASHFRIDFEVIFTFDDPQYDVVLRIANPLAPAK